MMEGNQNVKMNTNILFIVLSLILTNPSCIEGQKCTHETHQIESSTTNTSDPDPEHEGEDEELEPNG